MWNAYPAVRREGKVDTFEIWCARGLEPRASEIAAKLERLTLTIWAKRKKRYIPMPETWFNKARYEDDLVPMEVAYEQEARERLGKHGYKSMQTAQRVKEDINHDRDAGARSVLRLAHPLR